MVSDGILIAGNSFDASECSRGGHDYALTDLLHLEAQVYILDYQLSCGHCREVVYPQVKVVKHHRFVCNGDEEIWFLYDDPPHRDGNCLMVIHRCGYPTMELSEEELDLLLAAHPFIPAYAQQHRHNSPAMFQGASS